MQEELAGQELWTAEMNARLAEAWARGETWAVTDYQGLPLGPDALGKHRESLEEVTDQHIAAFDLAELYV